ncbi:MAG: class I SAM-dependent methyltransferase family protein, partial [Deltaproteobacteria bacterium]
MPRKPIPSFDELRDPLPRRSPKYWYYAVLSLMLRTVGMLSEGIRVGYTHGFDSGAMMNYIYENKPRGRFIIGRLIDQAFLNQITCRAFRSIKKIQKEAIAKQIAGSRGKPLFIADLASGKADYIYDALVE